MTYRVECQICHNAYDARYICPCIQAASMKRRLEELNKQAKQVDSVMYAELDAHMATVKMMNASGIVRGERWGAVDEAAAKEITWLEQIYTLDSTGSRP